MPNSLRIITYNIHRCIGGDHKLSPERISDVIAAHRPDIVALQEVDCGQVRPALYDQAAIIAERLSFPEVWIERERCGNAIVSRYPMKRVKAGGLWPPMQSQSTRCICQTLPHAVSAGESYRAIEGQERVNNGNLQRRGTATRNH